jgi:phospholipid/cholesterol/gamma-HCH transport system permease protein
VLSFAERWLKQAALETQEYVRLTAAALAGAVTRPIYRHDIVEQFDAIGVGSLTVVLLSGLFTGAALALQSGQTLDGSARGPSSGVWSARR